MRLEHLGLNVPDPVAMAAWYVRHLGMKIVRKMETGARTHFLDDGSGMMLEIYHNPSAPIPDYANMNLLELHVALSSADTAADRDALLAAGATLIEEQRLDDGTQLVMLRDPWGLALQLCKRAAPFTTA